jgi:sulfur-oxidizing protein SoxZ
MIINKFVAKFNGKEVFSTDMHPAISANPYFSFYTKVSESGTFEFSWTDDKGKTVKASRKITVK